MIFRDLNSKQKEAVKHLEGPLLILAGAGSGKTRVLTHRIAYILQKKAAYPNEILAVTFTNKAAGEMGERVKKLSAISSQQGGSALQLPFLGTFHSFGVKILRKDGAEIGIDPNFTIYDADDQQAVVKQAMKDLHIDTKENNPKTIHHMISSAKNELVNPEDYKNMAQGQHQSIAAAVYPKYQSLLSENNALDFDDLLVKTVELFRSSEKVLGKYQELFKFVLVDEYQDTNHAQYKLVHSIARKSRNICVVGDDDQAIYGWRGADIENILSFEKDYPEARIVKLEENYRSTKKILDAAHEVVKHNKGRKPKKLWTEKDGGNKIVAYEASDEKDEAKYVVEIIEDIVNEGGEEGEIAVLYRTNAQSRVLEEAFLMRGIPYTVFGGTNFYSRKEIKDVLAYLRMIYNPKDNLSVKRIINTPSRKIGAKTFADLEQIAESQGVSLFEALSEVKENPALGKFYALAKNLEDAAAELNVVKLIQHVLSKTGYLEWLDDGSDENKSRIENIKELLSVASKFQDLSPEDSLHEFLNEVSLIEEEQVKARKRSSEETVKLMTLHSAKGLEFKYVFIVGMEEGLFPHSRSYTEPLEMEEERRLAYVGITRAEEELYLTHAQERRYFGSLQNNLVSRFLEDIPKELIHHESAEDSFGQGDGRHDRVVENEEIVGEKKDNKPDIDLNAGDRVSHEHFGQGRVVEWDDEVIVVDFGQGVGKKELAIEYAKLKKM